MNNLVELKLPFFSSFLGSLVPSTSYKYVPMQALTNLEIQLRMNPYAFFTSGYTDVGTSVAVSNDVM